MVTCSSGGMPEQVRCTELINRTAFQDRHVKVTAVTAVLLIT